MKSEESFLDVFYIGLIDLTFLKIYPKLDSFLSATVLYSAWGTK